MRYYRTSLMHHLAWIDRNDYHRYIQVDVCVSRGSVSDGEKFSVRKTQLILFRDENGAAVCTFMMWTKRYIRPECLFVSQCSIFVAILFRMHSFRSNFKTFQSSSATTNWWAVFVPLQVVVCLYGGRREDTKFSTYRIWNELSCEILGECTTR